MDDDLLTPLLRQAHEREFERAVAEAPKEHRLHTRNCPPLAKLARFDRERWDPAEVRHIENCSYCRMTRSMARQIDCPSVFSLVAYHADQPVDEDAREHLKGSCRRCTRLAASTWVKSLAGAVRAGKRTLDGIMSRLDPPVTSWVALPATAGRFDDVEHDPMRIREVDPGDSLGIVLGETPAGRPGLFVEIDTPRSADAGKVVRVELIGDGGASVAADLTLQDMGESGSSAHHEWAVGELPASLLGHEVEVVAAFTEPGPA